MEVNWYVADGYAGNRPQATKIEHSDILDCDNESEVRSLVEDCIRNDFEQNISPDWSEKEYDKVLEFWREHKPEHDAQNN